MSRAMLKRLESLEQKVSKVDGKVHLLFGHTSDELEQKERELMASPAWREGDRVIGVRWVKPGEIPKPPIENLEA